MTDINDLDRHIGRYVDLQEGKDGISGYLVDVADKVDYEPEPTRMAIFDWGQGFPVSENTMMTFPDPPEGEEKPSTVNPVRAMHLAMHDEDECRNVETCVYEGLAARAVRGFRIWQTKQVDAYWENRYVREIRGYAENGDGHEVGDLIRDARCEGAPPHMVDRMEAIAKKHLGDPPSGPYADPNWDPFGSGG